MNDAVRLAERFWAKVEKTDSCWLWSGGLNAKTGYGTFGVAHRKSVLVHRWAYESARGPIPPDLVIDHLCRNRACVRPEHLEAVTMRENVLRGVGISARNAKKTHCNRGHEYTDETTYIAPSGKRNCRVCWEVTNRARYEVVAL